MKIRFIIKIRFEKLRKLLFMFFREIENFKSRNSDIFGYYMYFKSIAGGIISHFINLGYDASCHLEIFLFSDL